MKRFVQANENKRDPEKYGSGWHLIRDLSYIKAHLDEFLDLKSQQGSIEVVQEARRKLGEVLSNVGFRPQ